MREIIAADQPFVRHELSPGEAAEFFADEVYKSEIIERVTSGGASGDDTGEVGDADRIA